MRRVSDNLLFFFFLLNWRLSEGFKVPVNLLLSWVGTYLDDLLGLLVDSRNLLCFFTFDLLDFCVFLFHLFNVLIGQVLDLGISIFLLDLSSLLKSLQLLILHTNLIISIGLNFIHFFFFILTILVGLFFHILNYSLLLYHFLSKFFFGLFFEVFLRMEFSFSLFLGLCFSFFIAGWPFVWLITALQVFVLSSS